MIPFNFRTLICHCCHSWHSPQVVLMVKNLVGVLEADPDAVILFNETVLPVRVQGGEAVGRERLERQMGMLMLSLLGTRQRRLDEWDAVVKAADSRFEVS